MKTNAHKKFPFLFMRLSMLILALHNSHSPKIFDTSASRFVATTINSHISISFITYCSFDIHSVCLVSIKLLENNCIVWKWHMDEKGTDVLNFLLSLANCKICITVSNTTYRCHRLGCYAFQKDKIFFQSQKGFLHIFAYADFLVWYILRFWVIFSLRRISTPDQKYRSTNDNRYPV